ncbi:hypothetical protein CDAR_222111 [Caerostris darwini]|uniref:Uncharacterized protein n=1 Tax=Caerostris darwini TaxID=1538125 RepID=A0AAV4P4W7_9ARAC|nr:hypothetical protein CDAR_222111 [Caerostris darwini]
MFDVNNMLECHGPNPLQMFVGITEKLRRLDGGCDNAAQFPVRLLTANCNFFLPESPPIKQNNIFLLRWWTVQGIPQRITDAHTQNNK